MWNVIGLLFTTTIGIDRISIRRPEPTGVAYALTNADLVFTSAWEVIYHTSEDIDSNQRVRSLFLTKVMLLL